MIIARHRWIRNLILAGITIGVNYVAAILQTLIGCGISGAVGLSDDKIITFGTILKAALIGNAIVQPLAALFIFIVNFLDKKSDLIASFYDDHRDAEENARLNLNHALEISSFSSILARLSFPLMLVMLATLAGLGILKASDNSIGKEQVVWLLANIFFGLPALYVLGGGAAIAVRKFYLSTERNALEARPIIVGDAPAPSFVHVAEPCAQALVARAAHGSIHFYDDGSEVTVLQQPLYNLRNAVAPLGNPENAPVCNEPDTSIPFSPYPIV